MDFSFFYGIKALKEQIKRVKYVIKQKQNYILGLYQKYKR